ncbi:hypothetical protein COC45_09735 [Bacillus cereus]|nr:hypothetical protein CN424_19520 [Bacillus cereus]PGS14095.1 hypothetical protein COC45_09735 [Bacillus cereus]PGU90342.1 hypothetical protein COD71_22635 [Bacillus cereus]HDR3653022.1 hypothetical protein [Bacillus anthracis]
MSNQKYNTSEILENLSHIKTITRYKTEYCKQTSTYFIIWGFIWIVAYTITLLNFNPFTIGVAWFLLGVIGWIITLAIYFKQKKMNPMPLFLRNQLKYTWLGLIMILSIFVFLIYSGLLPYTFDNFSFYIVLLVSIMYILLGIVLTREIFFMGFWLSILGMITFSVFPDLLNIIFAFIGGGSLLLTGFILKRKGQGNE